MSVSKKVLIISPYFPPVSAADMHRIRMSLPFFMEMGWNYEIICVDEAYVEMVKDPLLLRSIPPDSTVHRIKAFSKRWTSLFGLGSIALRSLWHFAKKGNERLRTENFDLVYFSTTQFPVCILGSYWYKKFNIPYVIDMQDPWHSDYYQNKPKKERPKKYWFSYRLNKLLEPIAMKKAGGLIAVSDKYIQTLQNRYPALHGRPAATIPFGASALDLEIAKNAGSNAMITFLTPDKVNILSLGRGGTDMHMAISLFFDAIQTDLSQQVRVYFAGTSYAAAGEGKATILPLAEKYLLTPAVTEVTDRVPFYEGLRSLLAADILLITGSDDPQYTASKIYPYLQTGKPIIAILHRESSAVRILRECRPKEPVFLFPGNNEQTIGDIHDYMQFLIRNAGYRPCLDETAFEQYTARDMTRKQVELFNRVTRDQQH